MLFPGVGVEGVIKIMGILFQMYIGISNFLCLDFWISDLACLETENNVSLSLALKHVISKSNKF
jgi:hypothetical protein